MPMPRPMPRTRPSPSRPRTASTVAFQYVHSKPGTRSPNDNRAWLLAQRLNRRHDSREEYYRRLAGRLREMRYATQVKDELALDFPACHN